MVVMAHPVLPQPQPQPQPPQQQGVPNQYSAADQLALKQARQQLAEAQAYREQSQSAASRALHQSAAAAVLESLQVRFGKHRRASRWSHIAFVFSPEPVSANWSVPSLSWQLLRSYLMYHMMLC
jgi:hypothetical protein